MPSSILSSARQPEAQEPHGYEASWSAVWSRPVPWLVLLLSLLPVFVQFALHGYSSGHDLPFHLGSWQDAAQQLRHRVYPQWDYAAALGAGEPRFVFYPPLSWLLGAALSTTLTPAHASETFTLLALAASWLTMFATARRFLPASAALLAASVYISGPYTLFNAMERGAYGELLACAWLPLLFGAIAPPGAATPGASLSGASPSAPSLCRVAIPMALLWLTNVPTAIIGSYLFALLVLLRLFMQRRKMQRGKMQRRKQSTAASFSFAVGCAGGALLGLLLAAFFLVPGLHQSHFVQLNTAFSDGQTYADNFLLHHTAHTRRGNLHTVSSIAAEYIAPLLVLLGVLYRRIRSETWSAGYEDSHSPLLQSLALSAAAAILLLFPLSAPVWKYLPELSVLQFPWRLLCVLSLCVSVALAAACAPYLRGRAAPAVAAVLLAWVLGGVGAHQYWLSPDRLEEDHRLRRDDAYDEQRRATVEYTPAGADNAALHAFEPAYWLVPDPAEDAMLTMAAPDLNALVPTRLDLTLKQPGFLVLRLRNYPSWKAEVNGQTVPVLARPDGRIVMALPAGAAKIRLRWKRGGDVWLGMALSVFALGWIAVEVLRRKM